MDILVIFLDILLKPPQPLMGLFLNIMHTCDRSKVVAAILSSRNDRVYLNDLWLIVFARSFVLKNTTAVHMDESMNHHAVSVQLIP